MKTKKTLAFLLACAITVSITAFASCDDDSDGSIGNTSSSGSISDDLPSSSSADESVSNTGHDSETNSSDVSSVESNSATSATDVSNTENNDTSSSEDDSSQNGGMSEDAKAALKAAVEKTGQSDNYTLTYMAYVHASANMSGAYGEYIEEINATLKIDGNKSEDKGVDKNNGKEDNFWRFEFCTSKSDTQKQGYAYEQDSSGGWTKYVYKSYSQSSPFMECAYKKIYENLTYDENVSLYTLVNYTYTPSVEEILKDFCGITNISGIETEKYEGGYVFHEVEIELKDGYLYRFKGDFEIHFDVSINYEGNVVNFYGDAEYKIDYIFSDYGTTVVTLPAVVEKIENVELN